jgi:hypothetical protein
LSTFSCDIPWQFIMRGEMLLAYAAAMPERKEPWRIRFRVPMTVVPPLAGVTVAVPLWGTDAEPEFFSAATHVLAIGAVGMALTGGFFRLAVHRDTGPAGLWAILSVLTVLITVGVGLAFSFSALARGEAGDADAAIVAGALATGIAAFGVQALFGTPGVRGDEGPDREPPRA